MAYSCGIDFGTTNSAIASTNGRSLPQLIPLKNGKFTTPTAVFYPLEKEALPLFGEEAVRAFIDVQPGRFMRSMKRVLGSDLMTTGTIVNQRRMSFQTILSQFVAHLKEQAEAVNQASIENVVMGRPVRFRENDEAGDKKAEQELFEIAQRAGFKNIAFQFEPIAAAYAHEIHIAREQLACVADIGGGTSDFSIIRIGGALKDKTDRTDDILSFSGVRIGGNDFDAGLSLKFFMPEFGYNSLKYDALARDKLIPVPVKPYLMMSTWSEVNQMYTKNAINTVKNMVYLAQEPEKMTRFVELLEQEDGHTLLNTIEKAKIDLTAADQIRVQLNFLSDFPAITIQRAQFEETLATNLRKIKESIHESLVQAQIRADDVDMIILTGGSTEVPVVQREIKALFPKAVVSQENKLSSVGLGLAFDSLRRF